jgi:hypothetical protein
MRVVCKRTRRTRVAIVFGVCSLAGTQPTAVVALRDHTGIRNKKSKKKRVNRALKIKGEEFNTGGSTPRFLLPYYLNDYRITRTLQYHQVLCRVRYKGGIIVAVV